MKPAFLRLTETQFNNRLRTVFKKLGFLGVRIENAITSGAPDWWVNCQKDGLSFWVESKVMRPHAVLRQNQGLWHREHGKNFPVFVFALNPETEFVSFWQSPVTMLSVSDGWRISQIPVMESPLRHLAAGVKLFLTLRVKGLYDDTD